MPANWEHRDAKLDKRKTRMPKHGLDYTRTVQQIIVKKGKATKKVR